VTSSSSALSSAEPDFFFVDLTLLRRLVVGAFFDLLTRGFFAFLWRLVAKHSFHQ